MTDKNTEAKTVKTAADKIWEEIKDLRIEMFALPDQRVEHYCKPVSIDPTKLFLITTAGSVLPALEAVVGPKYTVEKQDKFLLVYPVSAKK